jgi:hypothetical protein
VFCCECRVYFATPLHCTRESAGSQLKLRPRRLLGQRWRGLYGIYALSGSYQSMALRSRACPRANSSCHGQADAIAIVAGQAEHVIHPVGFAPCHQGLAGEAGSAPQRCSRCAWKPLLTWACNITVPCCARLPSTASTWWQKYRQVVLDSVPHGVPRRRHGGLALRPSLVAQLSRHCPRQRRSDAPDQKSDN